jgi:hypothetical protein
MRIAYRRAPSGVTTKPDSSMSTRQQSSSGQQGRWVGGVTTKPHNSVRDRGRDSVAG